MARADYAPVAQGLDVDAAVSAVIDDLDAAGLLGTWLMRDEILAVWVDLTQRGRAPISALGVSTDELWRTLKQQDGVQARRRRIATDPNHELTYRRLVRMCRARNEAVPERVSVMRLPIEWSSVPETAIEASAVSVSASPRVRPDHVVDLGARRRPASRSRTANAEAQAPASPSLFDMLEHRAA
jgi:hypothetical protein